MSVELREREVAPPLDSESIRHIATTCCPPYTRTLCGLAIADESPCEGEPGECEECVVCLDLEVAGPCRRCGSTS
jgi:hypothetical protein